MDYTFAYYAFFALPALLWLVCQFIFRRWTYWLFLGPIAVMSCYLVFLIGVHLLDKQLEAELYKHDLNGDGSFSGIELTSEMEEAARRFTNDTGRVLAPITGIPSSLIWVTINYIPLGLVSLAIWRFRSFLGGVDAVEPRSSFVYGNESNLLAETRIMLLIQTTSRTRYAVSTRALPDCVECPRHF